MVIFPAIAILKKRNANMTNKNKNFIEEYRFCKYDGITKCVCWSIAFMILIIYFRIIYGIEFAKDSLLFVLAIHFLGAFCEVVRKMFSYKEEYPNTDPNEPSYYSYRTFADCLYEILAIPVLFVLSAILLIYISGMPFNEFYNIISEPLMNMYNRFRTHTFQELFFNSN